MYSISQLMRRALYFPNFKNISNFSNLLAYCHIPLSHNSIFQYCCLDLMPGVEGLGRHPLLKITSSIKALFPVCIGDPLCDIM